MNKGVDELGVLFTANTLLLQADIQLIVEEILVICAAVEDYGKGSVGVNTGAECR